MLEKGVQLIVKMFEVLTASLAYCEDPQQLGNMKRIQVFALSTEQIKSLVTKLVLTLLLVIDTDKSTPTMDRGMFKDH